MLALIYQDAIVSEVFPDGWCDLPGGGRVNPALDGWSNGEYRLAEILPADPVPEGMRVVSTSVEMVDGAPQYVDVLEDTPPVDLAAYAADKRWLVETGGISVGGVPVATDDRSKIMIIGARVKADKDQDFTTQWKTPAGFQTIDAATIIAISDAVLAHVDACFATENAVLAEIVAGTITTTDDIDAAGWPA